MEILICCSFVLCMKKKFNFEKIEFLSNVSSVRSSSYEEQTESNHYQ